MRITYSSVSDTEAVSQTGFPGISESSYKELNLRPSSYYFGCSTTELKCE